MSEAAAGTDNKLAVAAHWTRTPAVKIAGVLGLFVAMLVPQLLTTGMIQERESRQADVLATFRSGWGPEQVVSGPFLVVPFSYQPSLTRAERTNGVLQLAASRLDVSATLDPQRRRRGLFQATIYSAAVAMSGVVTVPPLPELGSRPDIDWGNARVVVAASDLRGMQPDQTMRWGGATTTMRPDVADGCETTSLQIPANLTSQPSPGTAIPFNVVLALRGTQAFHVAPVARQTTMHVTSSWPSPGFTGASLPISYTAEPSGFDARWDVAGEPSQAGWRTQSPCSQYQVADDSSPGVALQEAVPTYTMVDRAAKYGMFFLALAYLTLFLFEALSQVRVHLVQYGLVGLSVSLFALLLISIAEPLGFTVAYALSAAAVVAQASLYTLSVVGRARLAGIFACVLGALFGFIYVVLSLDSYALLAGTVALFTILSVLMAATRRVNWDAAQPTA